MTLLHCSIINTYYILTLSEQILLTQWFKNAINSKLFRKENSSAFINFTDKNYTADMRQCADMVKQFLMRRTNDCLFSSNIIIKTGTAVQHSTRTCTCAINHQSCPSTHLLLLDKWNEFSGYAYRPHKIWINPARYYFVRRSIDYFIRRWYMLFRLCYENLKACTRSSSYYT